MLGWVLGVQWWRVKSFRGSKCRRLAAGVGAERGYDYGVGDGAGKMLGGGMVWAEAVDGGWEWGGEWS